MSEREKSPAQRLQEQQAIGNVLNRILENDAALQERDAIMQEQMEVALTPPDNGEPIVQESPFDIEGECPVFGPDGGKVKFPGPRLGPPEGGWDHWNNDD
jgi:hypothetical protein